MAKNYLLNINTGTLHIKGKCPHQNGISDVKAYETEDEAISENKRYQKICKVCFRGR